MERAISPSAVFSIRALMTRAFRSSRSLSRYASMMGVEMFGTWGQRAHKSTKAQISMLATAATVDQTSSTRFGVFGHVHQQIQSTHRVDDFRHTRNTHSDVHACHSSEMECLQRHLRCRLTNRLRCNCAKGFAGVDLTNNHHTRTVNSKYHLATAVPISHETADTTYHCLQVLPASTIN